MCQETFELLPQRQRYMKLYNKFSWWMRAKKKHLVKPEDDGLLQELTKCQASLASNSKADAYSIFQQVLLETQAPSWIQHVVEHHMLTGIPSTTNGS